MNLSGGVLAVLVWLTVVGPGAAEAQRARIDAGVVVGESVGPARVFRAIPYAAPPLGPLRWAPPAPAPRWSGARLAVAPAPACPQKINPAGAPNVAGATNLPSYDARNFARDGVIVVAMNYRLGPLGFFAHPALTKAAAASQPLNSY